MAVVMDQTNDPNGRTLHRLTKLYDPPEFVKSASSEEITGCGRDLPPEVFGDPSTRQFPTHTPAAVYTSMMFFLDARPGMGKMASLIEDRIRRSARFFGIESLIDRMVEKHAGDSRHSIEDLPDEDFAAVILYENGQKERHLPMRNVGEVKAACEFVRQHRLDFTYDDRRVIAERVLKKAAQLGGVDGPEKDWLLKQAGWACGPAQKAAEMMFERAKALRLLKKDLPLQEELAKASAYCLENPTVFHEPQNMQKIASMIDQIDRQHGFSKVSGFGEPEDLFAFTVKEAASVADSHVQLTSGTVYEKAALAELDLADIRDVMGRDFADRVSAAGMFLDVEKLAEELGTLPRGDAKLFDQLAEASAVAAVVKEASASHEEQAGFLAAMAALHKP